MAGTKSGGKHAAATNIERYGADFYRKIGAIGGARGRTGGFFGNRELAREAGRKGGQMSRQYGRFNIEVIQSLNLGDYIDFTGESRLNITNRFFNTAKRLGYRISVKATDDGCRLTRVE